MSASERARKLAERREKRLFEDAMSGLAHLLESPQGRAFIWWFYSDNAEAEGEDGKGRRVVARNLMQAARIANWDGLQIMREEHEKPRGIVAPQGEPEGEDE